MRVPFKACLLPSLVLLSATAIPSVQAAEKPLEAKFLLDLRYRYEDVSQDNALHDADAHTLRTRLGYQSAEWHGWSGLLEVDNVSRLGGNYNDTRNGRTDHALIADPDGSEVNQARLRYRHERGGAVLGRQRINLDNQRFIGGVAWRQNEQTYDAALLQLKPMEGLVLSAAWVDNINTVFGPDNTRHANATNPANIEGASQLFNLRYEHSPKLIASAYHYRLGLDNIAVAATAPLGTLSSATTGMRVQGAVEKFSYALEYAQQKDHAGNPWRLDSDYLLAEAGYRVNRAQLKLGYEVLGAGPAGAANRAFQTPLATKHLFQGWADQFLTTPADGLVDRYLGAVVPLGGGSLQAWYHQFSADRGSTDFGSEVDLSYTRAVPGVKGLAAMAKYARYDSDDRSRTVDTEKLWLQLQYSY